MEVEEREDFIAEAFELAFGEDAINRGFSYAEVLRKLRDFSDTALEVEESDE